MVETCSFWNTALHILPMSHSMPQIYSPLCFACWECRRYFTQNTARIYPLQTRCYSTGLAASATHKDDGLSITMKPAMSHHNPKIRKDPLHRMPPGHQATIANLKTFVLPDSVRGTPSDIELGQQMANTWRKDGIFQIAIHPKQQNIFNEAFPISREYFSLPHSE